MGIDYKTAIDFLTVSIDADGNRVFMDYSTLKRMAGYGEEKQADFENTVQMQPFRRRGGR